VSVEIVEEKVDVEQVQTTLNRRVEHRSREEVELSRWR